MTHCHPDHTSSVRPLVKRTGARLVAHAADTWARGTSGTQPDSSDGTAEVRLSYLGLSTKLRALAPLPWGALVTQTVRDGQVLPVGDGIRVIHLPGHTPGSVSYMIEGSGVLFSGDSLFSDGHRISRSLPYPGSNVDDYRRSLNRLATMGFDVLCGGHGAPLKGGASDILRDLLAA